MGSVLRASGVVDGAVMVIMCVCVWSGGGAWHVEWPFGLPGMMIFHLFSLEWSFGLPGMLN